MSQEYLSRFKNIARLYGDSSLIHLQNSHVCVIGLGGVGSWAVEALARSGIGKFTLVDIDDICVSNINRQIQALTNTVGKFKADALRDRINQINPDAEIDIIYDFIRKENVNKYINKTSTYSVIVEAADSVSDKAAIINACAENKIAIVSTGGMGGLIDPMLLRVSDLSVTTGDNLLKQVRKKLRQKYGYHNNIDEKNRKIISWNIQCVHTLPTGFKRGTLEVCSSSNPASESTELNPGDQIENNSFRKCDAQLGNACFITGTAGFIMASIVTKMIATNSYLFPAVTIVETKESRAYQEEIKETLLIDNISNTILNIELE